MNHYYRYYLHHVIIGLIIAIMMMMAMVVYLLHQMQNRPLPVFFALQANDNQRLQLHSYTVPNLLPSTILHWASKAATVASTYDFNNYNNQLAATRPYFTPAGWDNYLQSVADLINTIKANKLIVNSVVTGTPVISNQGPLPDIDYAWQVQIPFLVSYQPASAPPYQRSYLVVLTIVKVPTTTNPQGIGIDQFVMD